MTYDEGNYVVGRWFESGFGDQPSALRSVAHFSELAEVIDSVTRGVGVSVVPRDAAQAGIDRKAVVPLQAGGALPCLNQFSW